MQVLNELSQDTLTVRVLDATVAGTTTLTTDVLDLSGFDRVEYLVTIGTPASNNTIKAQEGALASGSDMADLANSHVTPSGTAGVSSVQIDVVRQPKRFSRLSIARGTSTAVDGVFAKLYGGGGGGATPSTLPINNNNGTNATPSIGTQTARAFFSNTLTAPVEGTA